MNAFPSLCQDPNFYYINVMVANGYVTSKWKDGKATFNILDEMSRNSVLFAKTIQSCFRDEYGSWNVLVSIENQYWYISIPLIDLAILIRYWDGNTQIYQGL